MKTTKKTTNPAPVKTAAVAQNTKTKQDAKKVKPMYKVYISTTMEPAEVFAAFGKAKVNSRISIEKFELEAIVHLAEKRAARSQHIMDVLCTCGHCHCVCKKPNLFKRFWNWVTKK